MQRTIKMYTKTIIPAYEQIGKRQRLTGFIGELYDDELLIHAQEYSTNGQAENALNALTHELLMDMFEHGLVDDVPTDAPGDDCDDHGPYADDDCPKCNCGATATLIVRCHGDHPVCHECYQRQFEDNYEEFRGWEVEPIGWLDVEGLRVVAPTSGMVVVQIAKEAPESLREDCLNVVTMALGQTHGAASVVTELHRLKARLEAAGMSRIVALDY